LEKKLEFSLRSPKVYYTVLLIAVMALIPLFIRDRYIVESFIPIVLVYVIYSSSWNLLAYSGQASLGHAAFLGIGGFASALLSSERYWHISPWFCMFLGSAIASGIGFLIGLTCVRLREWFLAMVTFGFAVIAQTVTTALDKSIGGILGFPPEPLVSSPIQLYYVILALTGASVFFIYLIMKSKIGLAFNAIRENEVEAKMMGVNTTKYKLLAFVISTFFAGLAGVLQSQQAAFIDVEVYKAENSFTPLVMSIIGGLGSIEGPIIGSVTIRFIDELLYGVPVIKWIINGVFLVSVVIFLPKGISSLIRKALKRK